MWRELKTPHQDEAEGLGGQDLNHDGTIAGRNPGEKSLRQAVAQIVIADISMSLDNVLAVAGAAHDEPVTMAFGLMLSVLLMGVAATFIARLLHSHRWIAYLGLLVILFVALRMIWDGGKEVCERSLPMLGIDSPDTCGTAYSAIT
jgi:predicted tellurium resistance membrane protein TerC